MPHFAKQFHQPMSNATITIPGSTCSESAFLIFSRVHFQIAMSGAVAIGLGLAVLGFAGKYLLKQMPNLSTKMNEAMKAFPKIDANSKYYKGGFEPHMTKREACLILGVSPTASKVKVKEAHKRIMLLNHPDRGGSPYLAAKINEAKDFIESNK